MTLSTHSSGYPLRTLNTLLAFTLLTLAALFGTSALGGKPSTWRDDGNAGFDNTTISSPPRASARILLADRAALLDVPIYRRQGPAARRLQDLAPDPGAPARASAPSGSGLAAFAAVASAVGIFLAAAAGTSSPSARSAAPRTTPKPHYGTPP